MSNFLAAIATIIDYLLTILNWLIIIRALLSWVNPDPYNPIVQFIDRSTEPLLSPLRNLIPAYKIGIDISPIIALLLLYFLRIFIVGTLLDLAFRLR